MKKIILTILFISTIFTSIGTTEASKTEIDKILNINFGVEQIEYKLSELPIRKFKNNTVQTNYNKIKKFNNILTKKFYKKYNSGNIDYYTTKGIILNHQKFIFQTTKLFDYIEIKLSHLNSSVIQKEVNKKIINSYSEMRISYNRIIFLLKKSKK